MGLETLKVSSDLMEGLFPWVIWSLLCVSYRVPFWQLLLWGKRQARAEAKIA